jgi:hypothetical protein
MSPLYREHLVTMVAEILLLGIRVAASGDMTESKSVLSDAVNCSVNSGEYIEKFELI